MIAVNRLSLALAAYVALGVLSWVTMDNTRVRLATLAVLGMFALKTWVRRNDTIDSGASHDPE